MNVPNDIRAFRVGSPNSLAKPVCTEATCNPTQGNNLIYGAAEQVIQLYASREICGGLLGCGSRTPNSSGCI